MFCTGRLVLFLSLPSALLALVPGTVVIYYSLLFYFVIQSPLSLLCARGLIC